MALATLVLTSCASAPPQDAWRATERGRHYAQAEEGTALWVLRFYNEVNPDSLPTTLDLSVEDAARTHSEQFVVKPLYSVPGRWVEFVVRLDLPAGEYRVSRLVGVAGSGQMAPQFDFSAAQRFTVEPARTKYLGRIEIVNRRRIDAAGVATKPSFGSALAEQAGFPDGSPLLGVSDKSHLDLASLRARFADLRDRRIDNGLSQRAPLQEAKTGPTEPASPAPAQDARRTTERGRFHAQAEEGTVLWVLRFYNEVNPDALPTSLALTVEDAARTYGGQFVFKPLYRVSGRWVEFVVRLDLPAGEYRVSRLFGVAGSGQMAPQFDFSTEQRFAVEPARTNYLGRIEIVNRPRNDAAGAATGPSFGGALTERAGFSDGSPLLGVSDKSNLDLASLRARFADLSDRRIDNGLSQRAPLQAAKTVPRSAMPTRMRRAFSDFTAAALPRAFAHDPTGLAFGMASGGPEVIARALRECERRRSQSPSAPGGSVCVLYAQDDIALPEPAPAASR